MEFLYRNKSLPLEQRLEDLLLRMTREEKIGQLSQINAARDKIDEVRDHVKRSLVGSRILASSAFAGNEEQRTVSLQEGNICQKIAVEETRLGIPLIYGRDIIHGYRTVFPIPLAQAATFDPVLVEQASAFTAAEARSEGIHWTFAPMMDISRDPRWGRVIEGYGEDPYLASIMATATVKGFQGDDMSRGDKVAACAKHFIAYGLAEGGREYNTVEVSDNTLRNVYLAPFRAAVKAGVATVMTSFNEIGGTPVSGNSYLVNGILKKELGFDGFVVSDWGSVLQLTCHGNAADEKDAARLGFDAGVDLEMTIGTYHSYLSTLIDEGSISEKQLDEAVRRILRIKFKLGLFENPYTDLTKTNELLLHSEHRKCARIISAKSIVLLKNDTHLLPLSKEQGKMAVVGPMAKVKRELMGSWTLDGIEDDVVSVYEGIKNAAPELNVWVPSETMTDEAVHSARSADVIVAVIGEHHGRTGEGGSISDIVLPPGQEELLKALSKTGKPIVAVICAGRPLALENILQYCTAILYCWHGGTESGNAIADVLFGNVNPSGRVPMTMPRSTGQIPIYYNHKPTGQQWIGFDYYENKSRYVDISSKPQFPFGFGLSYTTFEYCDIKISSPEVSITTSVTVTANVTNTGSVEGEEVVQCYIRDLVATTTRPVRELKGIKRVLLKPGESKSVFFILGFEELAFWNSDSKFVVELGEFKVWIGGDCLASLESSFRVVR